MKFCVRWLKIEIKHVKILYEDGSGWSKFWNNRLNFNFNLTHATIAIVSVNLLTNVRASSKRKPKDNCKILSTKTELGWKLKQFQKKKTIMNGFFKLSRTRVNSESKSNHHEPIQNILRLDALCQLGLYKKLNEM